MKRSRMIGWLGIVLSISGVSCRSGSSVGVLEARSGRVIEEPARVAVPNADVYQVVWGPGLAGEPRPVNALRWTRADETGAFAFQADVARDARAWTSRASAPEYGFFHADFGLVRGGAAPASGELTLRGRRLDAAGIQAMELEICGSRPADEIIAGAARLHCKRSP